jgi:opacity protein-like surface antigen
MQQKRRNSWRVALVFIIFNVAASEALKADEPVAESHFQKGLFETSLGSGAMFSPFAVGFHAPTLNYTVTEAQLGYMLTDPAGPAFFRGNCEIAGSLFGGGIFEGEGTYVSGTTIWLRYNFVPHNSRFAPYVQGGAGLTLTDLNRRIEGQSFNFNLNLGAGVRYFLARSWSLNLEARFQHISNADMSPHNLGINAFGPVLSVSHFF